MAERPLDILEATVGEIVTVRLKDGEVFLGELTGYDQHMNLVLEPTEDMGTDDPNETQLDSVRGTTIIRGDNVVSISP